METRRFILYAFLAFILYSLWTAWQAEFPQAQPGLFGFQTKKSTQTQIVEPKSTQNPLLPDLEAGTSASKISGNETATESTPSTETSNANAPRLIHVKTDVLDVDIDAVYGDIVHAQLLNYPVSVAEKETPIVLLNNSKSNRYTANSGVLEQNEQGINNINFNLQAPNTNYQLSNGAKKINVVLSGQSANGLQVKKTLVFTKGSYLINVFYDITNNSNNTWQGFFNTQIFRTSPDEDKSSLFHIGSYTGASYSNPGVARYKKVNFTDMNKANLNLPVKGGWIAMQQHYFLTAWIPNVQTKNTFYTRANQDDYTIGLVSQPLVLKPGVNKTIGANLYVGPEVTSNLGAISPGLDLTIDYGWFWFLSSFLFTVMAAIYRVIGNWGWAIVLVTVLVKLVFYRLSASSYRSMAGMRKLQPKLQALRERFGDDKAKLSQATMELYRQEKINPLGGCLPIVVQIPVFIALYWVLLESVELRQAPFIFWIHDLAAADPFHILPIIMGLTMLIQQRLNPAPPDPMQAKMMMFLPILFTGLFWNFPAGLVLYWAVNNSLSILQQWLITRKYS